MAIMETEVRGDQVEVDIEEFEGWTKSGMSISDMTQDFRSGLQYEIEGLGWMGGGGYYN